MSQGYGQGQPQRGQGGQGDPWAATRQGAPQWQDPRAPQPPHQPYGPPPGYQPQYPPRHAQGPPAPPAPRVAAPKAGRKLNARGLGCLAVLAAAAVLVTWFLVSAYGGGGSFRATVTGYTAVTPAELSVGFKVTNTGGSARTPDCTVNASSPDGAYSGVDEAALTEAVQPGQTLSSAIPVTITGQGAQYVTSVTVSCR